MDHRIQQLQHHPLQSPKHSKPPKSSNGATFKDVLSEAQGINISKHAKERLDQRNITIDRSQWTKISNKLDEAMKKGITDSLVVTKDAALLVSGKNKTVVTALDRDEAASRIFTNINGTILIDE
jgi:flagellar operon protein